MIRTLLAAAAIIATGTAGFAAVDRGPQPTHEPATQAWLDTSVDPPILRISVGGGWLACERTSLRNVHHCGDALVDSDTGSVVPLPPEYRAEGDVP